MLFFEKVILQVSFNAMFLLFRFQGIVYILMKLFYLLHDIVLRVNVLYFFHLRTVLKDVLYKNNVLLQWYHLFMSTWNYKGINCFYI